MNPQELEQAGFSKPEIQEWLVARSDILLEAGFSKDEIREHLGELAPSGLSEPAPQLAEKMVSQMYGLDRQPEPASPFMIKHPNLWAAGQTIKDMPGALDELSTAFVSGATMGVSDRVAEAGEYLSRKLFGEGRKGGATGTWEEEEPAKAPGYMKAGMEMAGSMIPISAAGGAVAAPLIKLVSKSKYLVPFARMVGWGVTGAGYHAIGEMVKEGELPTPGEIAKHGATWGAIEGVMSALGWTGKLTIGLRRLSKLWGIPKKEVLKAITAEAKVRGMPLAKYISTKAKVQKVLSVKDKKIAKVVLDKIEKVSAPFKKQGTYNDLTNQLKGQEIAGRIKTFKNYASSAKPHEPVVKPKTIKGYRTGRILTEDLPDWVKRIGEDIRYGTPVPRDRLLKYARFFKEKGRKGFMAKEPFEWPRVSKKAVKAAVPKGEKVKAAALKFKDGTVVTGQTHFQAYEKAMDKGFGETVMESLSEGFTTTRGRYVSREQAKKLFGADQSKDLVPKVAKALKPTKVDSLYQPGLEAALKYPNGKIVTGPTHFHCLEKAEELGLDKTLLKGSNRPVKEGFVDSHGNFLSRTEATRAYGIGESTALSEMGFVARKMDERPLAKLYRRSGVTLGFGPTSQLQAIYEKLISGLAHRKPKAEIIIKKGEPEMSKPVAKIISAVKRAKPLLKEQERIYHEGYSEKLKKITEVGKTTRGEAGYHKRMAALEGGMERVKTHFKSVREIGQKDVEALFQQIWDNPVLSEWEKVPTATGLAKILGQRGGTVPTAKQLDYLKEVFGTKFVDAVKSKKTDWEKLGNIFLEAVNTPKALMASCDLSAPLRQGIFFVGRPKRMLQSGWVMLKSFKGRKGFDDAMANIKNHPNYKLMQENNLALTDLGSMTSREEAFMSTYAERIWGVGRLVKASSQAYTGFLNTLRSHVFNDIVKRAGNIGIKDPKFLKDTARFINVATGRGGLAGLESSAQVLNGVFFSPRLLTSRLTLLNPGFYYKLHPEVRKEALKSLFSFAAIATTVSGLAHLGGAKVGYDPRNADFMKIKVGNTRYDVLGGFQQPIRLAAQVISGEIISSTTGKTLTLGEGYKPITRLGIAARFIEYKEAPVFSFAVAIMRGETAMGAKVDLPTEIVNRFIPMVMQDMYDLYNEQGLSGLPLAAPAFLGVGTQTYGGVSTYGLNGKDYPGLNKELARLKIPMGFPSTSAYGQTLTKTEYRQYRKASGMEIAQELTKEIKKPYYKRASINMQKQIIAQKIDLAKKKVRWDMFPRKRQVSEIARGAKRGLFLDTDEARKYAKEQIDKWKGVN